MKIRFLFLLFMTISMGISAQDTLYMKSGEVFPVKILEYDKVEIRYKKFPEKDNASIYSAFLADVDRIRFADGRVVDAGGEIPAPKSGNVNPFASGDARELVMKFGFGAAIGNYERNNNDGLQQFWQSINGNNRNLSPEGNSRVTSFMGYMSSPVGWGRRHWLGANLQVAFTPKDAIHAFTPLNPLNEIQLRSFHYNVSMPYGYAFTYRKNLLIVFEPALDMGLMTGNITLNGVDYKVFGTSKIASHFALGIDWMPSKRVTASLRAGQKFMKIKEMHESEESSTGWASFYTQPGINKDLVVVNWSGPFVNLGISYAFYVRTKGKPEQTEK